MSEPVLGIDLGTSNSVLATVDQGVPLIVPCRSGGWLTPSMVAVHDGRIVAGNAARELLDWFPRSVATATKRYIGKRHTAEVEALSSRKHAFRLRGGPAQELRVELEDRTLPLTQVSALVLGELFLDAQRFWGRPVHKAVITVPANFDDGQRQATKEAAYIAGFELMRIINEPTAAALAFGMARKFNGRVVVFDLGGGTLDVTVLEVSDGVFVVKATGGHSQLGGEDFDSCIVEWMLEQLPSGSRGVVEADPVSMRRLRTAAEKCKHQLSVAETASVEVGQLGSRTQPITLRGALTRSRFQQLTDALWQQCITVCEQVMRDARMEAKDLEALLLVGGMTRVPRIRELLAERFGREPERGVSPDEVVALGAAIQASQVGSVEGETLLLDVAAHSMGVGYAGNRVRRLIAKNAPIPTRAEQCFLPARANQREAVLPIYQGEGSHTSECTKLGEVRLTELSATSRAEVPIVVGFELATDGTLSVRAQHPNTGEVKLLNIHSRTALSPNEVRALRNETQAWLAKQTDADRKLSFAAFRELLDEAERLLGSPDSQQWDAKEREAVAELLTVGRGALQADSWEMVATLSRGLPKLLRSAGKSPTPEKSTTTPVPQEAEVEAMAPTSEDSAVGSSKRSRKRKKKRKEES